MPFWHIHVRDVGAIHRADTTQPNYCPEHLLVFVHGVNADHLGTWQNLPAWVVQRLGIELDVFNFAYPSKAWHKTSVQAAASKLIRDLQNHFPKARNIFFVVHSTGGLVLKEALRMSYPASLNVLEKAVKQSPYSLWLRTRQIINFDVPHLGGGSGLTWLTCNVNRVLRVAYVLGAPVLGLRNLMKGGFAWGYNRIVDQLRANNPYLAKLDDDHLSQIAAMRTLRYPTPAFWDFKAAVADAVPELEPEGLELAFVENLTVWKDRAGRRFIDLPGNHSRIKLPERNQEEDPCLRVTAEVLLGKLKRPLDLVASERTLDRILFIRLTRVDRLAEGPSATALGRGGSPQGEYVSQGRALERLKELVEDEPRRVVLTGAALVGKSSILRLLSREFCIAFNSAREVTATLPLVFLLQDFTIDEFKKPRTAQVGGRTLWEKLVEVWCARANRIAAGPGTSEIAEQLAPLPTGPGERPNEGAAPRYNSQWFDARIRISGATTLLILDGVDEFLLLHAGVTLNDFEVMLSYLDELYPSDTKLTAVLGIRLSQYAATAVATGKSLQKTDIGSLAAGNPVLVVQPLTPAQIKQLFPDLAEEFENVTDPNLRRIMLIPVIADLLQSKVDSLRAMSSVNRPGIYRLALEAILDRGELTQLSGPNGRPLGPEPWVAALSIVAPRYFEQFRASMPESELRRQVKRTIDDWTAHAELPTARGRAGAVLAARPVFDVDHLFRQLCVRTILVPTVGVGDAGDGVPNAIEWKIFHMEFSDFLIANYLANCIEARKLDEFAHRAHTTSIFQMTGEILAARCAEARDPLVTAELIEVVVATTVREKNWLVFGNFGAVVGNSRVAVEGPAVDLLLLSIALPRRQPDGTAWNQTTVAALLATDDALDIDVIVRHIMLSSWCYRALQDAAVDPFARVFREALLRPGKTGPLAPPHTLMEYAFPPDDYEVHPLTRSFAWTALMDFHVQFQTPRPPELPTDCILSSSAQHIAATAAMVYIVNAEGFLQDTACRSFQNGLQMVILAIGYNSQTGAVINAMRANQAAHYLYVMTCVLKAGKTLLSETPIIVEEALKQDSPLSVCFDQRNTASRDAGRGDDMCWRVLQVCRAILGIRQPD